MTVSRRSSSPLPAQPARAERRAAATRQRILESAVRLFAELGYEGTSMDLVAADADVARATVFNHFRRKDELLTAVLAERRRVVRDRLAATAGRGLSTRERIDDAIRHWARAYESEPDLGRALVRAWIRAGGPHLPDADGTAELFTTVLLDARLSDELSPAVRAAATGFALQDALIGAIVRWASPYPGKTQVSLQTAMRRAAEPILSALSPQRAEGQA